MLSKKIKTVLVTLGIGFLATANFAITPDDILSSIKTNLDKVKTVQAYYIQTMTSSIAGREPRIESGKLYRSGKKFRKDIQKPQSKLIISSDTLYYDKNNVSGTIKTHGIDLNTQQNPFLGMSPEEILKKYTYVIKEETSENYNLEGHFEGSGILVEVDKKEFLPRKITILVNRRPYMFITLQYETVNTIPVLKTMDSLIKMEGGKLSQEVNIHLEYQEIKINEELNPALFEISSALLKGEKVPTPDILPKKFLFF